MDFGFYDMLSAGTKYQSLPLGWFISEEFFQNTLGWAKATVLSEILSVLWAYYFLVFTKWMAPEEGILYVKPVSSTIFLPLLILNSGKIPLSLALFHYN